MTSLTLSLFGSPQLERDGVPIHLPTRKCLALLAYLTLTRLAHRRATLTTLFWPESGESQARSAFRSTLTRLRQVRGDDWLVAGRDTIGLDGTQEGAVDVLRFRVLLAECRAHRHPGNEACPGCLQLLEQAVPLYRGDFMAGFTLHDSPQFDVWQSVETEALRRELAWALERLVGGYASQGNVEQAAGHANRWLDLDPLDEGAHRALMQLYAASGQQTAALRQYEACEWVLAEELGVSPSLETAELHQAIRERRVAPLQLGAQPPGEPSTAPRHNLPTFPVPFVGRVGLLADIRNRLKDPDCRLLSLVGAGGSGKTRLALEAATEAIPSFRDGVFFVSLAPLQSVDAIVPAVAQALSFPLTTSADRSERQQLLDYLRGKQMLLMLDNFEHLLGGVGLAIDILGNARGVRIITTSRARLNVQGECLLAIPGMNLPPPEAEAPLEDYSAVELFLQGARRVRSGHAPSGDDLEQVAQICRLVDGMPLAILLAASWLTMLDPAEIMSELTAESLSFLETDWRDVPERQRSMRAVLEHSWGLLSKREQAVLAGLSVFRGGFGQQAARRVMGTSLRELRTLINRSLVQRTPEGRYEIHELLRQYAAEQLALRPIGEESARDRHSAYYSAALQRWEGELHGPRQAEAMVEMIVEADNARAAWDWAVGRGDMARVHQAMDGLCRFYEWRGRLQEGEIGCRQVVERLGERAQELPGDELRVLVRALGWQGAFNLHMGRTDVARRLLRKGMVRLDEGTTAGIDMRPERAFLLQQLGRVAYLFDREESQRCAEESLALYRELDDRWGAANLLSDLGEVASNMSSRDRAKDRARGMFQESLRLRRSLGDQRGVADVLHHLQEVAIGNGRVEESDRLSGEAIEIYRNIGDQVGMLGVQLGFGLNQLLGGEFLCAHRTLEDVSASFSHLGLRQPLADASWGLGLTKIQLGLYAEAYPIYRKAMVQFRSLSDQRGIARSLDGFGRIALAEGAPTRAARLQGEAVRRFQRIGQRHEASHALTILGLAQRRLGRLQDARQTLRKALTAALELGHFLTQTDSVALAAMLGADEGELERAIELYALATRYPHIGRSRHWEDIVGRHVAAFAATLPPEVVAAAEERGRTRDLKATVAQLLSEMQAATDSG